MMNKVGIINRINISEVPLDQVAEPVTSKHLITHAPLGKGDFIFAQKLLRW